MSIRPIIITPRLIRRHNVRCFGRMVLWALAAGAVFLVLFLFFWLLASLLTGSRALTWPVSLGAVVFGVVIFVAGHFHLKKHGPQDWERIAQKPDQRPGMRLSRMSNQDYGQIGLGLIGLLLAGAGWLERVVDEGRSVIAASRESARELESLREHLAARDAWVPMNDFSAHEEGIYLLARLNILAIREFAGEWYFHVTVQGSVTRSVATEMDA